MAGAYDERIAIAKEKLNNAIGEMAESVENIITGDNARALLQKMGSHFSAVNNNEAKGLEEALNSMMEYIGTLVYVNGVTDSREQPFKWSPKTYKELQVNVLRVNDNSPHASYDHGKLADGLTDFCEAVAALHLYEKRGSSWRWRAWNAMVNSESSFRSADASATSRKSVAEVVVEAINNKAKDGIDDNVSREGSVDSDFGSSVGEWDASKSKNTGSNRSNSSTAELVGTDLRAEPLKTGQQSRKR